MGLRPARAGMKMEYGGGALSEQITEGEAGCADFFRSLLKICRFHEVR